MWSCVRTLQWAALALPDMLLLVTPELYFSAIPKAVTAVINFPGWNTDMTLHSFIPGHLFHSVLSPANHVRFFTKEIHSETQVQSLWYTCPFLSPFMPLFLIGFETCWEGRICRQKCLRSYIGSIVSIWWTLCGSPEKNSYPSVYFGYVRRDCSLINTIGVLDSSRSGCEMKWGFHQAVVNKEFPFGTPFQLPVSFFLNSLRRFLQILRGLAGECHNPVKMCRLPRTSAL